MTREAEIRQTAAEWLRYNHPTCTQDMLVEAFRCGAEWADKHQPNPWISVEDRLPGKSRGLYKLEEDEQHKHVLFRTRNGLTFSGYLDAEEIWRDERTLPVNYITPSPVTHWMPIPELKKGE